MPNNPNNPEPMFNDEGNLVNEPPAIFPVLLLEIEEEDKGWDKGWRYQVEQLDEHVHFFSSFERAEQFVLREGMDVISIPRMKTLREAGITY